MQSTGPAGSAGCLCFIAPRPSKMHMLPSAYTTILRRELNMSEPGCFGDWLSASKLHVAFELQESWPGIVNSAHQGTLLTLPETNFRGSRCLTTFNVANSTSKRHLQHTACQGAQEQKEKKNILHEKVLCLLICQYTNISHTVYKYDKIHVQRQQIVLSKKTPKHVDTKAPVPLPRCPRPRALRQVPRATSRPRRCPRRWHACLVLGFRV